MRITKMTPRAPFLVVLGVLATAWPVYASCGWFGTQLECDLGASQVVVGSQVADAPSRMTSSLQPQRFRGTDRILERLAPDQPLRLELQSIGADPSLCRKIGNESYCY